MVTFLLRQLLLPLILVKLLQKPVNILLLQVVRSRQPQLVWFRAADADLMHLPQPVFQIHARDRWDVHRNDSATQGRVGRRPGFGAALLHLIEDVVGELAMTSLDAVEANVVRELDRGAQSPERRDVRTSDALKAFGAKLLVIPAFGGDGVPQAVDDFVANVEKAGAFGRL